MWKPSNKRRPHPYYKVQINNKVSMSWRDIQGAFDTLEEAKQHIKEKLKTSDETRIMIVEEKKRYPLDE